jgi:hypothetical protein
MRAFSDPRVAEVFAHFPAPVRPKLLKLRELIFQTAAENPDIGRLEETLKWGQPSYLTNQTKSGSTIRLDALREKPDGYALYFHCQTNLVETFRKRFGRKFSYEGNRALHFSAANSIATHEVCECLVAALTYHLHKKAGRTPIGELINRSRA